MTDVIRDWVIIVTSPNEDVGVEESEEAAQALAKALGWPFIGVDSLTSDRFASFLGRTRFVAFTRYPPDCTEAPARVMVLRWVMNSGVVEALYNVSGTLERFHIGLESHDLAACMHLAAGIVWLR